MSAAHPGSTPITDFSLEKSPRCKKPISSLGIGMSTLSIGPPCCLHDGHMGKCKPHPEVPPIARDPLSQPYNPNLR